MADRAYTELRNEKTASEKILADAKAKEAAAPVADMAETKAAAIGDIAEERDTAILRRVCQAAGIHGRHADLARAVAVEYLTNDPQARAAYQAGDEQAWKPHEQVLSRVVARSLSGAVGIKRVNPDASEMARVGAMSDRAFLDWKREQSRKGR